MLIYQEPAERLVLSLVLWYNFKYIIGVGGVTLEEIMVVQNIGEFDEDVFYCGTSEIEAFKNYKRLKNQNKKVNVIKAKVVRKLFKNVPFIWNYEIIEYIK